MVVSGRPRQVSGAGLPGPQILPRSPNVPAGAAAAEVRVVPLERAGVAPGPDERPQPARITAAPMTTVPAAEHARLVRTRGIRGFYACAGSGPGERSLQ